MAMKDLRFKQIHRLRKQQLDYFFITSICIRFKSKIHNLKVRQMVRSWDLNQ